MQPVCAAVMRESNRCDVVRHSRWPEHACVQVSRSALKLENLIKSGPTGLLDPYEICKQSHQRAPHHSQLPGRQRSSTRDTLRSRRLASPMLAQRCLSVCARAAALRGPRGRRTQWEGDDRATVTLRISLNNHYIRACAAPLRVRLSTSVACAYNPLHLVVQP